MEAIIVILIVVVACILFGRAMYKSSQSAGGCGCSCSRKNTEENRQDAEDAKNTEN